MIHSGELRVKPEKEKQELQTLLLYEDTPVTSTKEEKNIEDAH